MAFIAGGRVGSYTAVIQGPGGLPERFENIFSGLQSVAVTPGTGYKFVPTAQVTAPQIAGGIQASVQPTLTTVGAPVLGSGGAGFAANDIVTFGTGLQIKVLTVTSGAIATFSVVAPGLVTSGAAPTGAMAQTATSGSGTGATVTATWGLGQPNIIAGSGYYNPTSAPITVTLIGGGAATPGSYAPTVTFWAALATAINAGTPQRGASSYIVFATCTSSAPPVTGVPIPFAGGTDGATGVTTQQLVGTDGLASSRTGMYALRGTGVDAFELCDCTDVASWGPMLALGIQEAAYPIVAAAVGTSIEDTVALRQNAGIDDPYLKVMTGDWPSFYDGYNGLTRLVSPCAIVLGLFGNLSPEQGTINKPLIAVSKTQTSSYGIVVSSGDESFAETGGVDVIGKSEDLNEDYFSLLTGRNSSSNSAANGDEYTRLTNFLIKTYEKAGRDFVGRLQSQRPADPTRTAALQTFDSLDQSLVDPASGSNGYGMIDAFLNICDLTNNPPQLVQRGYLFLTSRVRYLNVVRYFVINLFGGGNVSVTVSTTNTLPIV